MSAATPAEEAALLRAAAEAGSAEAQARYGQALLDGHGVPADAAEGLRWFRLAAKSGHAMAINMIGRCHEKGWGTPPDRDAATRCYKAAAEAGLDWGMYNYAGALGLGSGVDRDEAAAASWFQKAAARGHAKSITVIGTLHEEGRLTPRDRTKAAECYARGAEGGDFRGQFHHARLLAEAGRIDQALGWIARAAEAATPEFKARMKAYLAASGVTALEQAATGL